MKEREKDEQEGHERISVLERDKDGDGAHSNTKRWLECPAVILEGPVLLWLSST